MSGHAVPAQRWVRIIPVAFLMYTFAFIDRNDIAFDMFGIQKDPGIAATASGLAAGIFFFGYVVALTGSFNGSFVLTGILALCGAAATLTMTRRPIEAASARRVMVAPA